MAKKNRPQKVPQQQFQKREGKFPYYVLPTCIKLGSVVKEHGGDRAGVPKPVIAQGIDMEQGASTFGQIVASAKTWGIVDGLSELRLTSLGCKYFFPTTDTEKRAAELNFLIQPPAFEFLVKRFDGARLPSVSILANVLREVGVPESWRIRCAQIFLSAASELRVVDSGGCLRYESVKHMAGANGLTESNLAPEPQVGVNLVSKPTTLTATAASHAPSMSSVSGLYSSSAIPIGSGKVWLFAGGAGKLETPDPLSHDVWVQLKNYVEHVLKPAEPQQQGG